MLRPAPLLVVVVTHGGFVGRARVFDGLVRRIHRDPDQPFSPNAAVPVVAGTFLKDGTLSSPFPNVERAAILLLLDDHAVTDTEFLSAIDRFVATATPEQVRVFPVPLTAAAYRSPSDIVQTNFLRFDPAPKNAMWRRIGTGLVQELCRWLQGRPRTPASSLDGGESESPITVFLSHAKADGATIAQELQLYLQRQTRLQSFFDAHDIAPGFPFAREIEDRIGESLLLVVRTDAYGTREWCQREVLAAKRLGVPVVVVDALESSERRSFPYLGNVPTIRYRLRQADRYERVVELLIDETLRQLHFRVRVARLLADSRRKPVVLPSAPELVQFALVREHERRAGGSSRRRKRYVVYPDPPLSGPEADVLAHDAEAIAADSLTQFAVRRATRIRGSLVGVSVSRADDLSRRGLSSLHLRDMIVELARYIFAGGARLAYGGDFRKAGFAELLVEVARAHARSATSGPAQIVSYVPQSITTEQRAARVDVLSFVNVDAPGDDGDSSSDRRRARYLRRMRRRVASDSVALVAVGGRTSGFASWRPGVAEEIATAVAVGRPVYLVGGFGGVTAEYAGAAFLHEPAPNAAASPNLGPEPAGDLALPDAVTVLRALRKRGANGLSKKANERLATTVDVDEVVQLVLAGLCSISPAGADSG